MSKEGDAGQSIACLRPGALCWQMRHLVRMVYPASAAGETRGALLALSMSRRAGIVSPIDTLLRLACGQGRRVHRLSSRRVCRACRWMDSHLCIGRGRCPSWATGAFENLCTDCACGVISRPSYHDADRARNYRSMPSGRPLSTEHPTSLRRRARTHRKDDSETAELDRR